MATRTMGMNLLTHCWDEELLAFAGIGPDQLSQPVPSGTVVGRLSPTVAAETTIPRGALLVAGGHDQACAALGAGVTGSGLALDSHGTAEVVSMALDAPMLTDAMYQGHFPCYAHVVPGKFFTFSLNHTAGILLKWFVEGFCAGDREHAEATGQSVYGYVLSQAADEPSPLLVLPYFNGKGTPDCDLSQKGLIAGLTLNTTRHDIARAIAESLCFDLRANIEALGAAGIPIDALRAVGGGARSEAGLRMKADVTGLPVTTLVVNEAACLGAAMLAGMACGVYSSAGEAAKAAGTDKTYTPDPARHALYSARYGQYRRLAAQNRALLSEI
jgi:xylulokinase